MCRFRGQYIAALVGCVFLQGAAMPLYADDCLIQFTTPPNRYVVPYTTNEVAIAGTAAPEVSGTIQWTNSAAQTGGEIAADTTWSIPSIPLAVGTNFISVSGMAWSPEGMVTNASDNGSASAYASSWPNGSNGGTGFGAWSLQRSTTDPSNAGFFMGSEGHPTMRIGPRAWGLYANSGNYAMASRPLSEPLQVGQTISFRFQHNEIQEDQYAFAGGLLDNSVGEFLFYVLAFADWPVYELPDQSTGMPITDQGLHIAFTLTGPTNYSVTISPADGSPQTFEGSLISSTNGQAISRVRFWNYNAGSGSEADVFANDLMITAQTGGDMTCSDSISVIRLSESSTNPVSVVINEFVSSNGSTIFDEDGDYSDWLELYNYGSEPVNLLGYGLTDNLNQPFQWVFPDVTLQPGEYRIVWASGKDRRPNDSDLGNGILREVYMNVSGHLVSHLVNHPSYPDSPTTRNIVTDLFEAPSNIADNYGQRMHGYLIPPVTGDYRFWIASDDQSELYLSTDDDPANAVPIAHVPEWTSPREWNKYSEQQSALIPLVAGQRYYIRALMKEGEFGDNLAVGWRRPGNITQRPIPGEFLYTQRELHANFAISVDGEFLQLTAPGGIVVDQVAPAALRRDISYGRLPGDLNEWRYFSDPTPGSANTTTSYGELVDSPQLSVPAGMYTSTVALSADVNTDGAVIRYTTDGSEPTPSSPIFPASMNLNSRIGQPNGISLIPTNPWWGGSEGWLAPDGEVFKVHTIRARAFKSGAMPSPIVTQSYLIDPDGSDRYSMPVFFLATHPDNFFSDSSGIYVHGWYDNYMQRGPDWERPAHIEFFEADGTLAFAQDIGVRIHGGTTRNRPRKSLRIYARAHYGESTIHYPLFPDKPVTEYKRFLLRQSGNDWDQVLFRDTVHQSLMKGSDIDIQYSRPAILFVNGEYWGIHNIRDRYDDHYLNTHYGTGDENNITIMETLPEQGYVYERGNAAGIEHFNNLYSFLDSPGVSTPANLAYVETQMDVNNFLDNQIARIFYRDTDWPGNNQPIWRYNTDVYDPSATRGKDGRWRWMLLDTDFGFGLSFGYVFDSASAYGPNDASNNTLAFALDGSVPLDIEWPNPRWSTMIMRRLMLNETVRHRFVNRFADLLNTTFASSYVTNVLHTTQLEFAPEMDEHIRRWGRPIDVNNWNSRVNVMRTFAQARPGYVRSHIVSQWSEITGTRTVTVDVSDPAAGWVRVNTIDILPDTPGVGDDPYPWTGTYFKGVSVPITPVANPGYVFVGWADANPMAMSTFSEDDNISLIAQFEELPPLQPIHYWSFNDTANVWPPAFTVGGASLAIDPGPLTVVTNDTGQSFFGENARFGDPAGAHLRLNDPLESTMTWTLPTTGYEDILVMFETRRSGQGAGLQVVDYSTNGTTFVNFTNIVTFNDTPILHALDFAGIESVDDNSNFTLRITFEQADGSTVGNNRFDNFTVDGRPLDEPNSPPVVDQTVALQRAIEGGATVQIDLDDVFSDPDDDPLTYGASSSNTNLVTVSAVGSMLTITPVGRGDAIITISADDGFYAPVQTTFRVLVYPSAHELSVGTYAFDHWASTNPAGAFPPHMLFLQGDQNDSELTSDLDYPYHIPLADAALPADADFPYAATSRTRINGVGDDGIVFINTGRGRDLGGALLALDTTGVTNAPVSWLAGTVLTNVRVYAIRLQYRVGIDGPFLDVLDEAENPVEYVRNTVNGHVQAMPIVSLPEAAMDEDYVQVLWRYYRVSGESGARAQLRLDNVVVAGADIDPADALAFMAMPMYWQSGQALSAFSVKAVNQDDITDPNFNGTISLALASGPGTLSGQTSAVANAGVAVFTNTILTGSGLYTLEASSGALATDVSDTILIDDEPVFIPSIEEDWTEDGNWTSATYPDTVGASARIHVPTIEDRNINIRAPITVGHIVINHTNTSSRNRIRDRSTGNTLTFDSASGPATLQIDGSSNGWVEIEVDAGTVLATNLQVVVNHMEGDLEFGALRLRSLWTGPGGLIKTGYGVASLTGVDKAYEGPTLIEQGVLRVTEPATPTNTTGVTVLSGGQLRLVSSGEPRVYAFGGPISLSGSGRGGPVPEGDAQGISGALRYDPGVNDNVIELANDVHVAAPTVIHVDGTRNIMNLSGALSGTSPFSKTGGGILQLSGSSAGYSASITNLTGELRVDGTVGSPVYVTVDTLLRGSGRVAALSGQGQVAPGPESSILTATSVNGLNYAFRFAQLGAPDYAQATNSGNAVLRLTAGTPIVGGFNAGNTIRLYFDVASLSDGDAFLGGFFTDADADFIGQIQGATWIVYVANEFGPVEHDGQNYSVYGGSLTVEYDTVPASANFGDGVVNGRVLRVRFTDDGVTDGIPNSWWSRFPAIDVGDRVAATDYDTDGFSNWEEYVADTDPTDPDSTPDPGIASMAGQSVLTLTTGVTTNSRIYDVWRSVDLTDEPQDWERLGLNVPGDDGGNPVPLSVTNSGPFRAYRTGVALP